jgi:hypothetical protein
MHGSTIQQATEHSSAKIDYKSQETTLRDLVRRIRNAIDELKLSPGAQTQLEVDVQTVEVQLSSAHPKAPIVSESLYSIRNILEGTVGSILASGLVFEISKFLG